MNKNNLTKATAVAKLRERYYELKKNRKPSEKLKELLRQEPKQDNVEVEEENKKVAHPRSPHNEINL